MRNRLGARKQHTARSRKTASLPDEFERLVLFPLAARARAAVGADVRDDGVVFED